METMTTRLIAAGVLFFITILSGIWLSHAGKPYHSGIFTVHKLIAVGVIILTGISVTRLYQAAELRSVLVVLLVAVSGLFFLALVITGALLSLNIPLEGLALKIHQAVPVLALGFSAVTVFLLTGGQV
jgi:hypothetical protein